MPCTVQGKEAAGQGAVDALLLPLVMQSASNGKGQAAAAMPAASQHSRSHLRAEASAATHVDHLQDGHGSGIKGQEAS